MPLSNRTKNQHLLWRAGFGPKAENAAQLETISQQELWQQLLTTSQQSPQKFEVSDGMFDMYGMGQAKSMENKKELQKQRQLFFLEQLKALNLDWLFVMTNSAAQLREKMSLFWHGHFATKVINGFFNQI